MRTSLKFIYEVIGEFYVVTSQILAQLTTREGGKGLNEYFNNVSNELPKCAQTITVLFV